MKKHANETAEQKQYRRRLTWKKVFLYLAWFASVVAVLFVSFNVFEKDYQSRIQPQIDRAVIQVARLLPQMEQNEATLRDSYNQMIQSWENILKSDDYSASGRLVRNWTDASFEELVGDTLSWLNRVTKLKVGRDGLVAVVSKETGRIVAHPDEKLMGGEFYVAEDTGGKESAIASIETINALASPNDLKISYGILLPRGNDYNRLGRLQQLISSLSQSMFGSAISYGDYYIVCGVPAIEYITSVIFNALLITAIYMAAMWFFVHWICLEMEARRETAKSMRNKLVTIAALLCVGLFGISFFVQHLSNVANDLKTMAKHADVAVDTLNAYDAQSERLNDYMDGYYLVQCRLASALVDEKGAENLTSKDIQRFADALKVKCIYVFDRDGKVVVTNSNFDNFEISEDPAHYSNQFRRVLEGLDQVVLSPLKDEWRDEYIQYLAVNRRDENGQNNGLVLIGVDPAMRDSLLKPLSVNTVLENLVIGLPDYALAVDKETMRIAATTGLGYKGSPIEDLGISANALVNKYSGTLTINGEDYYAGIAESSEYYLITAMLRSDYFGTVVNSLILTLVALAACFVIILLTMIRYQEIVLDGVPEEKAPDGPAPEDDSTAVEEGPYKLLSGFTNILRAHEKKDMQDRWHMDDIPKDQMTPEQRIGKSLYRLMTLFCLLILLPTLYESLNGRIKPYDLNNLAYVISGNWQKGVNIFALTTCVFLLCAMYVIVVLLNQILYRIAKYSDMRVETVCLLLKNAIKYVCVITFVYYGLSQFGVQTQTLLASAGILSMMISFGAKDLVGDIISGFFTIVEGTYKVGDYITVGGFSGIVSQIGLRTTRIRWFSDTKIISNSAIRDVVNSNGEVACMALKMPISYEADLPSVEAMLNEELPKLMDVIPGLVKPPVYQGVDSLGDSSVVLRIAIYVKNSIKMPALRSLTREIKLLFDQKGIEIPYNQLVLHNAPEAEKGTDRQPASNT